jgi:hypothetical protein
MSDLNRAIAIAVEAHAGQRDQAGEPYILHPLRVMLAMGTDELRIVAVLHDVVEDSPLWGIARLEGEGFAPSIIEAVRCLTKLPGEPYLSSFILRCGRNELARPVKIADVIDNGNENRLANLPDAVASRLRLKYRDALIGLGYDQP